LIVRFGSPVNLLPEKALKSSASFHLFQRYTISAVPEPIYLVAVAITTMWSSLNIGTAAIIYFAFFTSSIPGGFDRFVGATVSSYSEPYPAELTIRLMICHN
jgi:hypothetical protein